MSNAATMQAIGLKISAIDDYSKTLSKVSRDLKGLAKLGEETRSNFGGLSAAGLANFSSIVSGNFDKVRAAALGATRSVGMFVPAMGAIAGVGAVAGLAKVVTGFEDFGSRIDYAAKRLNMPVQQLYQLQNAARMHGATAGDLTAGLSGLQETMQAAVYGRNNEAANLFRNPAVNIDIGNYLTGAKNAASVLPQIADATQKIAKNSMASAARFLDMVGVGHQLLFVFKDGSEGLARYNAQAAAMGKITQQQVDAAQDLRLAQTQLAIAATNTGYVFASEVGPALIPVLKQITGYLTNNGPEMEAFFKTIGDGVKQIAQPTYLNELKDKIVGVTDSVGGLVHGIETLGGLWLVKKIIAGGRLGGIGATLALSGDTEGSGGQWTPETRSAAQKVADAINAQNAANPSWFDRIDRWIHGYRSTNPGGIPIGLMDQWRRTAGLAPMSQVASMEDAAADRYGVPRAFARGIFANEGGLNPDGTPRVNATSGAIGAGQLMPATAGGLGVNPFDTASNIDGSVRYMKQQLDRFHGNWRTAAAAYNWGPNRSALEEYEKTGNDALLPPETRAYVRHMPTGDGPAAYVPLGSSSQSAGSTQKLQVEVIHQNPPPGADVKVTSQGGAIDVSPPRVVRSMPGG